MNKAVFTLVPRMMAGASLMVLWWICFLLKERNFVLVKTALDVEINCEQTSCGRGQRAAFCTMFNYLFVLLFVHFIVSCNFRSKLLISESFLPDSVQSGLRMRPWFLLLTFK